ncbi:MULTISPECIES: hypothetical protein [Streptomyces]|uniref:hypothetical protein n=1 Tax=Streptomyces TaxID=1883 RepID=UPI001319A4A0|nr:MULTISPECIES: hypothetical protein [Streptomyces]QGZ51190.1 hypothetical protein GPZ77_24880 [Streptomyces sp. QHH-9511]GGU05798.1 hypothetical protein GCM10010272_58850 [Streptomyces lateritius]
MPLITHEDRAYALRILYSLPDDAWYVELDDVADNRTLVTAIVPDEDPAREPTVCFDPGAGHREVPYGVMRWFMEHVAAEIRTSRDWMELRPELVEIIRELREEYLGLIDDDRFPAVLTELRAGLPDERDLAAVLDAAFGRNPDGSVR